VFSAAGFLKTTGPRDIEASPEGSRRFAYSERPARCGGPGVDEFDISLRGQRVAMEFVKCEWTA
jgi:hypothetical protein